MRLDPVAARRILPAWYGADFAIRTIRAPGPGAHPFERAVYEAVEAAGTGDLTRTVLTDEMRASTAVDELRSRLGPPGYLATDDQARQDRRRRLVRASGWSLLVLAFAYAMYERTSIASVFGWSLPLVIGLFTVAWRKKTATKLGSAMLRDAAVRWPRPRLNDSEPPRPLVPELGLLLAIHGTDVLWDFDPALAVTLRLPHPRDGDW